MSQKIDLERHQLRCLEKKKSDFTKKYKDIINCQKQTIKNQKQTIKDLQNKLENIAIKAVQKSTTTNINYIQKMEPITKEHLVNHIPQLTIEHIKKGASGYAEYAEYALEGPLKDKSSQLVYSLNNADTDSSMFEGVAKLFNTNADVKNGAIGIKTDFYKASMFRKSS